MKYPSFHYVKKRMVFFLYQCILVDFSHKTYYKEGFGCTKILDAIFIGSILYYSVLPYLTIQIYMHRTIFEL